MNAILLERTIFERTRFVAGLVEAFAFERVAVDDQDTARSQVADIRSERRRIHRHEGVHRVARRVDIRARKVNLKSADARKRSLRVRISAGKSGKVAMSLPIRADVLVNCVPASCMPSPESPQNRTVASSSVRICLSNAAVVDIVRSKSSTSVAGLRMWGVINRTPAEAVARNGR